MSSKGISAFDIRGDRVSELLERTTSTESATESLVPLTERPTSKALANHSEQTLGEQPLNPTDHHHNHFEEPPKPRTTDLSYIIFEGQQSSKTKQHTPPRDKEARTTKAEPTPLSNFNSNRDQANPTRFLGKCERVEATKLPLSHPPNQRQQARYERLLKCITCVCLC